jgi:uncharacterized RDD family membrane protein YckC
VGEIAIGLSDTGRLDGDMDTNDVVPLPAMLPTTARSISGFWQRIGALAVDSLVLGLAGALSGIPLFDDYAKLGGWGRLIGFGAAFLYFGILNSAIGDGKTVGKRVMKIEVVEAHGNYISPARSSLRYLVLGTPFFLNGAPIGTGGHTLLWAGLLGVVVIGAGGAISYLCLFNRRTRQSLHDLAVGTYVTNTPGSGPLTVRPIWRGHLAIIGVWCLAVIDLLSFTPLLAKLGPLENLLAVQQRIQATGKVSLVAMFAGTNWSYNNGSKNADSFVQAKATMRERPGDYDAAAREIAATILANYPGILRKDSLTVTVSYGYDIGIANAWVTRNFRHSPQEWAGIVGSPL